MWRVRILREYSGRTIHSSVDAGRVVSWYYSDPTASPVKQYGRLLPICKPMWRIWRYPMGAPCVMSWFALDGVIIRTKGLNPNIEAKA